MKKIIVLMILICVATPLYAQSKSTDKVVVQQTKSKTEIDQQIEKLNIRIDSISIAHNQATNKEEKDTKNISDFISIILSAIAILASAVTYFKHDKKLKEQERTINAYQLKQIEDSEIEAKKANITGTTHKDSQNATILKITNTGKSIARNIRVVGLDERKYCFYGPDILPYEFLNPGDSFNLKFTANLASLHNEKVTYYWDDDFMENNHLEQIISVR